MFGISSEKSHIHKKERTWNKIKIFQKIPKNILKFILFYSCLYTCVYVCTQMCVACRRQKRVSDSLFWVTWCRFWKLNSSSLPRQNAILTIKALPQFPAPQYILKNPPFKSGCPTEGDNVPSMSLCFSLRTNVVLYSFCLFQHLTVSTWAY